MGNYGLVMFSSELALRKPCLSKPQRDFCIVPKAFYWLDPEKPPTKADWKRGAVNHKELSQNTNFFLFTMALASEQ